MLRWTYPFRLHFSPGICPGIGFQGHMIALLLGFKESPYSATLNMPANLENSAVATGLEKVSFHANPKERQCQRMLILHASKVMLKILQARLQQYVNFQMFKLVLEKAEEPEIKLPTSAGSWKNQESSRKTSIFALLTMPKSLCGS